MEKQEKQFAKGFSFKRNDNAPEWAIGKLSIKAQEAIQFINEKNNGGWLNLEIKKSKEGKFYIELDTYQAKPKVEVKEEMPF
jgi:hypothetical protein